MGKPEKEGIPVAWHKAMREVWPALFTGLSLRNNLSKEPQLLDVLFFHVVSYSNLFLCEAEEGKQQNQQNTHSFATGVHQWGFTHEQDRLINSLNLTYDLLVKYHERRKKLKGRNSEVQTLNLK